MFFGKFEKHQIKKHIAFKIKQAKVNRESILKTIYTLYAGFKIE